MAQGSLLQTRLAARVLASPHRLVVVFPPATTAVVATPTNPFGPTPVATLNQATPTPSRTAVTLHCLWADGLQQGDLHSNAERALQRQTGWYSEATAVARVLVSEAATDPAAPYAGTVFDAASYITFQGLRYDVLQWTPVSAGHLVPVTYAVWVRGAQQQ